MLKVFQNLAVKATDFVSKWSTSNVLFHRVIGAIYMAAFYSLYVQFRGLYGWNGILPIDSNVASIRNHFERSLNGKQQSLMRTLLKQFPALPIFANDVGISVDGISEAMLCVGLISSVLIVSSGSKDTSPSSLLFFISWLCYLSALLLGQTFLSFQWDILLVEVGFLCIFTTSASRAKDAMCNWAYRFLAFKLLFLAGVVKIQATCPTWEKLTALEYHFATQPISNPIAWFAHQLPPVLLRFGVAATLLIEIPFALLLISPLLLQRRIGVVFQVLLQVLIVLTGNYNFFNFLTLAFMIPAWASDDEENDVIGGWFLSPYFSFLKLINDSIVGNVLQFAMFLGFSITSAIWMFRWTPAESNNHVPWWMGSQLTVIMPWDKMQRYMIPACFLAVTMASSHCALHGCNLMLESLHTVFAITTTTKSTTESTITITPSTTTATPTKSIASPPPPVTSETNGTKTKQPSKQPSPPLAVLWKLGLAFQRLTGDILLTVIIVSWIYLSAVPLHGICDTSSFIPKHVNVLHQETQGYHLVSGYGLFRRMTGVGPSFTIDGLTPSIVARPEVVVEGLQGSTNEWVEIYFKYKPTDVTQPPPFVAPHQPRLDWQMWFAALGNYQTNPWFVHLVWKILQMDQSTEVDTGNGVMRTIPASAYAYPEVLSLLDMDRYPFPLGDPPRAIRAHLYDYDFTRLNQSWNRIQPYAEILNITWSEIYHNSITQIKSFVVNGTQPKWYSKDPRWWYRRNQREFLPVVVRGDRQVPTMLQKAAGIIDRPRKTQRELYHDCLEKRNAKGADRASVGNGGSLVARMVHTIQKATCHTLLFNEHGNITLTKVLTKVSGSILPLSLLERIGVPLAETVVWKDEETYLSIEFIALSTMAISILHRIVVSALGLFPFLR